MTATEKKELHVVPSPVTLGADDDPRSPALVRAGDLIIDQNAQRAVRPERLQKLAQPTDVNPAGGHSWRLMEGVTVNRRANGDLAVVEGQTRVELLRKEKGPDIRFWVMLLTDEADEAGIAKGIAKSRSPHTPFQLWQASLRRGEEREVLAEQVLADLQLQVTDRYLSPRGGTTLAGLPEEYREDAASHMIAAVAALTQIMDWGPKSGGTYADGADMLRSVLSVISTAFASGQPKMWDGVLIRAVAGLMERNDVNLRRMTSVLSKAPAARWLQERANRRPGQSSAQVIAAAVAEVYNLNLRSDDRRISWRAR